MAVRACELRARREACVQIQAAQRGAAWRGELSRWRVAARVLQAVARMRAARARRRRVGGGLGGGGGHDVELSFEES